MEPRHWGRSLWCVIFLVLEQAARDGDLERAKRRLFLICNTLPCVACRAHALEALQENNVLSSSDLNYVYFFFIALFNNLARDPRYRVDVANVRPLPRSEAH